MCKTQSNKSKSGRKEVMTDRKLWLPLQLKVVAGKPVAEDRQLQAAFPMIRKLQAFKFVVTDMKAFPAIKGGKIKVGTVLTCLKTGYSSALVLDRDLFGMKVFFGERDVVKPMETEIKYSGLEPVVEHVFEHAHDSETVINSGKPAIEVEVVQVAPELYGVHHVDYTEPVDVEKLQVEDSWSGVGVGPKTVGEPPIDPAVR